MTRRESGLILSVKARKLQRSMARALGTGQEILLFAFGIGGLCAVRQHHKQWHAHHKDLPLQEG